MNRAWLAAVVLPMLLCACNGLTPDSQPNTGPVSAWPYVDIYPTPTPTSLIGTSSSGLWPSDANLFAPTNVGAIGVDNAIVVTWDDTANTTHTGYILCFNFCQETSAIRVDGSAARYTWLLSIPYYNGGWLPALLEPGRRYNYQVVAVSERGISDGTENSVQLSQPTITIGYPNGSISRPIAEQAFAVWDFNNNGIVDSADGASGAFPLFPTNIGANSAVGYGNRFDRNGNVRANVIVGYYFFESGTRRFVAYHMYIDPTSNQHTPVSLLYGDTEINTPGRLIWVGGVQESFTQVVIDGDPNIIQGRVTGPVLASDQSSRIIEFTFSLALFVEQ